jgi:hypothetical protein
VRDFIRRFLGRPTVKVKRHKYRLVVGLEWHRMLHPEETRLEFFFLPGLFIELRIPFRAKVWPYYGGGRWYHDGTAPNVPAIVREVEPWDTYLGEPDARCYYCRHHKRHSHALHDVTVDEHNEVAHG